MNIGLGIGIPFNRSQIWLSLFDPSKLFTADVNGVWYDPSDTATLYRDAAGTLPVTAVEQPVGLMLDKSKGLGPELVTNGDFSSGATGWAGGSGAVLSTESEQLKVQLVGGDAFGNANQALSLTIGATYKITCTLVSTNGAGSVGISTTAAGTNGVIQISTPGTLNGYFVATASTLYVTVRVNGADANIIADNISVRELPGNHAFNPSGNSANFPVLSSRYNILNNTETLATQSVTTRAAKYILSFLGTGSVALSGTYTGTLAGTGADNRVYVEFTATAGTLTLTVTGSVLKAQLEEL